MANLRSGIGRSDGHQCLSQQTGRFCFKGGQLLLMLRYLPMRRTGRVSAGGAHAHRRAPVKCDGRLRPPQAGGAAAKRPHGGRSGREAAGVSGGGGDSNRNECKGSAGYHTQ